MWNPSSQLSTLLQCSMLGNYISAFWWSVTTSKMHDIFIHKMSIMRERKINQALLLASIWLVPNYWQKICMTINVRHDSDWSVHKGLVAVTGCQIFLISSWVDGYQHHWLVQRNLPKLNNACASRAGLVGRARRTQRDKQGGISADIWRGKLP